MVIGGRPPRSHAIRVAQLGTNVLEQAAAESAAQDVRGDGQRRVIGIAQHAAQLADGKEGLRHVVLRGEINSRRGLGAHGGKEERAALGLPAPEQFFELVLHLR